MRSLEYLVADLPEVTILVWELPDGIDLDRIEVTPEARGKGIGTEAMQRLSAYADEQGLPIRLTSVPDGLESENSREGKAAIAELQGWYRSFGFVEQKGTTMERLPREESK